MKEIENETWKCETLITTTDISFDCFCIACKKKLERDIFKKLDSIHQVLFTCYNKKCKRYGLASMICDTKKAIKIHKKTKP